MTRDDADAPEGPASAGPVDEHRLGLSPDVGPLELLAAGLMLLIPVLDLPGFDQSAWAVRAALFLVAIGPGVAVLIGLARQGDTAARWAVAYTAWAVVAAAASRDPLHALVGGYGVDRGALMLAGYLGCWAIGRRLSPDARSLLVGAALVAVLANVALGVAQVELGSRLGVLAPESGRAFGFTTSAVYLGGLTAGGLLLAGYLAARADGRNLLLAVAAVAVLAFGANLSGSRIALLVGAVGSVAAGVRIDLRKAAMVAVAVVLGVGLSLLIHQSQSTVGRVDDAGSSGVTPRIEMWKAAGHAIGERPVAGWGPGQFRTATSTRVTPAYVRHEGQDRLFFDGHDLFVEQATTVGLVGLVLLLGWLVTAVRSARGPTAWLALGIALTWLLEPASLSTAPMALLALGFAAPRRPPDEPIGTGVRRGAMALGVVGLVAGLLVLYCAHEVKQSVDSLDVATIDRATRVFPPDPVLSDVRTQILVQQAQADPTPARKAAALASARHTVALDPDRPTWSADLGWLQLAWGSRPDAMRSFAHALDRDPWSEHALEGQRLGAKASHDTALERESNRRLCAIASMQCLKP